ncbi:signal recognition particle-docking protein FtsY [Rhizobiaceae bacterium CRRU44]|uniref:Signal recognition particle receptor FtsY n=1 Tax=Ferranicluibacter rubi TaxID=2715133 RepID=A0AA43ZFU2_9HYPH|nr:signal recognition particle-docking protein FtsY [Ferranicluibacter rubi]NHT76117.1 signal recognition particle-docking protein FtsY [Ferranicluibacter rubi]
MAFDFLKRVFTFDQVPPEAPVADERAPDAAKPAETAAPVAEDVSTFEPSLLSDTAPEDSLPIAEDPVLAEEIATAGGPAADDDTDGQDTEEPLLPLPAVEDIGDLGVVPLSLLEAEAELAPGESPTADLDRPRDISALPAGFATGPAPEPEAAPEGERLTWFQRLRAGLSRTSSQLTGQITALFTKRKLDDATLEELEDLLIQADLGVETALRITDTLASERYGRDVSGADVSRIMAAEITKVLTPVAKPLQLDLNHRPHVILVVGVNGTGKTTTIGKLAAKLSGAGLKVMLAAGDTFRAAAIEQLKIWADRTNSHIVSSKLGADAAGLAYEAFEEARRQKSDVLIIDTAGRLQNRTELMAELEKIVRVLGKLDPDAPHTVLQTLDATTGQNALNQVEIFRNVAGVNGLIMTKLDGTARGGILVAISAKHKLPVYFIGVGEGIDDLEPFEAQDFAEAIAGIAD